MRVTEGLTVEAPEEVPVNHRAGVVDGEHLVDAREKRVEEAAPAKGKSQCVRRSAGSLELTRLRMPCMSRYRQESRLQEKSKQVSNHRMSQGKVAEHGPNLEKMGDLAFDSSRRRSREHLTYESESLT
jgi:hypothetical protein